MQKYTSISDFLLGGGTAKWRIWVGGGKGKTAHRPLKNINQVHLFWVGAGRGVQSLIRLYIFYLYNAAFAEGNRNFFFPGKVWVVLTYSLWALFVFFFSSVLEKKKQADFFFQE